MADTGETMTGGTVGGTGGDAVALPERFWSRLDRDVVSVAGPEATAYLQGQLSQDVAALPVGGSAWSWLLAPTGKVDALLRVTRRDADDWLLDTDGGWGDAVAARLNRFKLRTRAEITAVEATVVALRGDGWDVGSAIAAVAAASPVITVQPPWPGQPGADLLIVDGLLVDGTLAGPPATVAIGAPQLDAAGYEAWRIAAGIPRMGAELTERTIPGETGLIDATVSFTKGCYTGQELVARIDSRGGNVPRRLWVLSLSGPAEPGAEVLTVEGGAPAATLTSVAVEPSGHGHHAVALGYVRRGVEAGTALRVGEDGPEAEMVRPAG